MRDIDCIKAARVPVDLDKHDVLDVLLTVERRQAPDPAWPRETCIQIKYRGQWRLLGRTDLLDDVRTSVWGVEVEEAITEAMRTVVYGARVTENGFFVIDRLTDG